MIPVKSLEDLIVWRNFVTNEQFHLVVGGRIYCSAPIMELDRTRHGPRGELVGTISSSPHDFVEELRTRRDCIIVFLHPDLMPRSCKTARAGRLGSWVKWRDKTDGVEYVLKSDYTVRRDQYHIAARVPSTTDVLKFIRSLRQKGHAIVFVHPRFQKPMRNLSSANA